MKTLEIKHNLLGGGKYTNIHVYTYDVHLIQLSWDMSYQVLDHAISCQIAEFNGPGENIETISNYNVCNKSYHLN